MQSKKSILNKVNVDSTKQPLFFGEGLSLQRFDRPKYPEFMKLISKQWEFFWRPEEIDLSKDRNDFKNLSPNEQFIFTSNLKFQTMLDSVIARGANTLLEFVSNPELETCIATWAFFENIHSYSYTYIIQNIYANPSEVLDSTLEDKEILKRAETAARDYDLLKWGNRDKKEQLYLTLVSINILEAVRFYVSFVCAFCFAENKKMIGNADIIKQIKRDEACVTPDTEVLTKQGWKKISEIDTSLQIAQYNHDGSIDFVKPFKIIKKYTSDNLTRLFTNSNSLDMMLTNDHRVIFEKNKVLGECQAENFKGSVYNRIPVCGVYKNDGPHFLSMYERFLIALQADGSISDKKKWNGKHTGCHRVSFTLTKDRKKKRLLYILDNLGLEYSVSEKDSRGRTQYNIKVPNNLILTKEFSEWVRFDKDYVWCQEFIDEASNWDGHVRSDTGALYYSSSNEKNTDIVQAIGCLAGYKTNKFVQEDNRKDTYSNMYRLSINTKKQYQSGQSIKKDSIEYKGNVYCVSVPSGMFIARRNGNPFVTGNCHLTITQTIINILRANKEEGFQEVIKKCEDEAIDMFKHAVNEEKAWADYLFKDGSLMGLNSRILHEYIEWLANSRMTTIGLPSAYPDAKNVIRGWIDAWMNSEKVQVAPQEHEITSYKISASRNDLNDLNLGDLEI